MAEILWKLFEWNSILIYYDTIIDLYTYENVYWFPLLSSNVELNVILDLLYLILDYNYLRLGVNDLEKKKKILILKSTRGIWCRY